LNHVWGYATDRRLREENEDSHGVFEMPKFTLALVCDGMGGHAGGAEASSIAVKIIHDHLREYEELPPGQALGEAVRAANTTVYEVSRKVRRLLGMGTTVAAMVVQGAQAWVAHVGDSRVYLVRGRRAKLLTRDHTMVNLFVDAELLSPEDASSHPEAHILARSVGVDRSVEVDVQGPIDLRPGDVLIACSDGVHGAIDDEELGEIEWKDPQKGVEQVLKRVRGRDGDDNATVVAVAVGVPSVERQPPTKVPYPDALAAAGITTGNTEVGPVATPVPQAPRPSIRMPGAGAGFVLEGPPVDPSSQPSPQKARIPEVPTHPTPTATAASAPGAAGPSPRTLALGAAGLATVLALGVVALVAASGDGEVAPAQISVVGTSLPPAPVPTPDGPGTTPAPTAEMVLPEAWSFAPVMPSRGRIAPHRPSKYAQLPPGGTAEWEAVQAARNRECSRSFGIVREAMKVSMDHAPLYVNAWTCVNDNHQGVLARSTATTPEDFRALLVHFEGTPTGEAPHSGPADWASPARGGVEYRLDTLLASTSDDLFADVMLDRLGGPAMADQLARDIALETHAAVMLSRIQDPTPEVTSWWARRVYYAARAMDGMPGALLTEFRPDLRERFTGELDVATRGAFSDAAAGADLPPVVRLAVDAGRGRTAAPAGIAATAPRPRPASPRPVPGPTPEPEPTPPPAPVDLRPIVHRNGENPIPEGVRQP
jgi:serine/threonine protein phosphatase PrpC